MRDKEGFEVIIVPEGRGQHWVGAEVKAAAMLNASDFHGLRKFKESASENFVKGVVLCDGDITTPLGEGLDVVPIGRLGDT